MWNLPRPGIKPMFAALAGGFSTTDYRESWRWYILIHKITKRATFHTPLMSYYYWWSVNQKEKTNLWPPEEWKLTEENGMRKRDLNNPGWKDLPAQANFSVPFKFHVIVVHKTSQKWDKIHLAEVNWSAVLSCQMHTAACTVHKNTVVRTSSLNLCNADTCCQ